MLYVCAWCERELRRTSEQPEVVSHGLCSTCADQIHREFHLENEINRILAEVGLAALRDSVA